MTVGRAWLLLAISTVLVSGCEPEKGQPVGDPCDRGVAKYEEGRYDEAITDYTDAIRLDPKIPFTYLRRAGVYVDKGDYDKAIADYTETIRLDAESADAYHGRGVAYEKKGDDAKAKADFAKAEELGYEGE